MPGRPEIVVRVTYFQLTYSWEMVDRLFIRLLTVIF